MKPEWTRNVPLLVRAVVPAKRTLFIAGPPDLLDEEKILFLGIVLRVVNVGSTIVATLVHRRGKPSLNHLGFRTLPPRKCPEN